MMINLKLGDFFRRKEKVSLDEGDVDAGSKWNNTSIVPSAQFLRSFQRLNLITHLKWDKNILVLKLKSSSSPDQDYCISVSLKGKDIKIVHSCPATQEDPPQVCWHEALTLMLFDILNGGKANQFLKVDWSLDDVVVFFEQVYQDLKGYNIVVDTDSFCDVKDMETTTITKRTLASLKFKAKEPVQELRLGKFIDPLNGLIIKEVTYLIKNNTPFILIGDVGCGKTLLIEEIAKHYQRKLTSFLITRHTTTDDVIGMWQPNRDGTISFQPGILSLAMHEGSIAYFDELPKGQGSLLSKLYSVLDGRKELYLGFLKKDKNEPAIVTAGEGFLPVASGNIGDRYGNELDDIALFDRFHPVAIPYLPPELEKKLMLEKGFESLVVEKALKLVSRTREAGNGETTPLSTRFFEKLCREASITGDFLKAVERNGCTSSFH